MTAASVRTALGELRADAVAATLRSWPSAAAMVEELGFLQYDPIARPARAQDLILVPRVPRYPVGRLDREYPRSGLDEDDLHVYGVMSAEVRSLVHPRGPAGTPAAAPTGPAADVRAVVAELGSATGRDVARLLDRGTVVNDWGGISSETTQQLAALHHAGWVRVRGRVSGHRAYEPSVPPESGLDPAARLECLVLVLARLLAPVSRPALHAAAAQLQRNSGRLGDAAAAVTRLLDAGRLRRDRVDGEEYLRPEPAPPAGTADPPRRVRFLAPFDPVVWDRRRFLHLWDWEYRLEAYTPPARRRFGYYALPLLWGHRVVGWVNAEVRDGAGGGVLDVAAGYAGRPPGGRGFAQAFDAEVARLSVALGLGRP